MTEFSRLTVYPKTSGFEVDVFPRDGGSYTTHCFTDADDLIVWIANAIGSDPRLTDEDTTEPTDA